ncbi:hypothetical protein IIY68_04195 [Candidatus Saccharibacteria bacterium]|nr:hypothetical protein [Candidatus Saccharibacteria bacterium]
MHDCTFLIWVIPAASALIFAVITGWINIYAPNKGNDESAIHNWQRLIVKERLKMWKISTIFTVATIITAGLFLYWTFSTEKLSFSSPTSGANAVCAIALVIFSAAVIIAFLNFIYVIAGSIHESIIERQYSKIYQTKLITTRQ